MDYIYDIVLNFQNEYYDFYEWKTSDKVINIKKIPVYMVNDQDYLSLKYDEVAIDIKLFSKFQKMLLVTNGLEVMGILLDESGRIIKRSSLLIDESDEVLEDKETIKALPLKYKKNIKKEHIKKNKIKLEKINYLENYFNNININKDEYILKYIYYDIYNKEENNITKVEQELKELINTNINKIYNSIKKITIELNI